MNRAGKITVVIADDQDVYLEGLAGLLNREPAFELVGQAADGKQLLQLVESLKPDVVLTDLKMPVMDGVQAIREIKASGAPAQCIVLSVFDSDQLIIEALEAGAMGYIVKNAAKGEIVEAVHTVYRQRPYYCSTTTMALALKISGSSHNPYPRILPEPVFDEREIKIINGLCRELTSGQIARELFLSKKVVDVARSRILQKLDVKTTIGIVLYAIRHGIYREGHEDG